MLGLVRVLETIDPASERVARLGMRADIAGGDRGGARRRYARLRDALAREPGVEPGEETERLHRAAKARGGVAKGPDSDDHTGNEAARVASAPEVAVTWWRKQRWVAIGAILLAALGALLAWQLSSSRARATPAIAVLPFRDLAPGEDYFAEGVAEEILAQLAGEPGIQVAGRTSSWLFGDGSVDVREIGRRLDVDYVLEGSVRRDGERVRVDVTLVDTANGMRLWSHPFEGRLEDIFTIQRDIARDIRERLQLQLVHAAPATGSTATSGEVYTTWLIARGMITRGTAAMCDARSSCCARRCAAIRTSRQHMRASDRRRGSQAGPRIPVGATGLWAMRGARSRWRRIYRRRTPRLA